MWERPERKGDAPRGGARSTRRVVPGSQSEEDLANEGGPRGGDQVGTRPDKEHSPVNGLTKGEARVHERAGHVHKRETTGQGFPVCRVRVRKKFDVRRGREGPC